jgi:hypothetical protein
LPNGFENDSDFLGGSAPHEDQDLELKKQELELCQTGPKCSIGILFFLEYAGELCIIILKERKVRNGPKYNAITGKNK